MDRFQKNGEFLGIKAIPIPTELGIVEVNELECSN